MVHAFALYQNFDKILVERKVENDIEIEETKDENKEETVETEEIIGTVVYAIYVYANDHFHDNDFKKKSSIRGT